jgi:hypothetical protein
MEKSRTRQVQRGAELVQFGPKFRIVIEHVQSIRQSRLLRFINITSKNIKTVSLSVKYCTVSENSAGTLTFGLPGLPLFLVQSELPNDTVEIALGRDSSD